MAGCGRDRCRLVLLIALLWSNVHCSQSLAGFFGDIAGNTLWSSYSVGVGNSNNGAIAEGFKMTDTRVLSSVDIYLSNYVSGAGSSLQLSIFGGGNTGPTGSSLFDLFPGTSLPTGGSPAILGAATLVNFQGAGTFTMTADTTYWLSFYATNPNNPTGDQIAYHTVLTQAFSHVDPVGPGAVDLGQLRITGSNMPSGIPSTSDERVAFQLNDVQAVPEPSGIILGTCSAGLVLGQLRRRRRAN